MSQLIHAMTGVRRPRNSPDQLTSLAARYQKLSAAANHNQAAVASIVSYVQALNEGPTVDAFSARMKGAGSAHHQLEQITTSAAETSTGYFGAASTLASTLLAMDITTTRTMRAWLQLVLSLDPDAPAKAKAILAVAKAQLTRLEQSAVAGINSALNVSTPPLIDVGSQRPGESLTEDMKKMWASLSPEHRLRLLKLLAEEYARKHGVDPVPEIEIFHPAPGSKEENWAGYWDGNKLHINGNNLDDPIAMNIIIHESQHAVQSTIAKKYDALTPQQRQDMRDGKIPDIFATHGSSIREAERFSEADKHYQNSGPRYGRAPKEIDAGRGVYEWSDELTESDLQDLINRTR